MSVRKIRLLHVEDDPAQCRFVAHHLGGLREFEFEIHCAANEPDALSGFDAIRPEFVILDYHLDHGNGLDCLRALRGRDPIVPIVAISGVATDEIAAELLQVGADDYISKKDMTSQLLGQSVRQALVRADALGARIRRHPHAPQEEAHGESTPRFPR